MQEAAARAALQAKFRTPHVRHVHAELRVQRRAATLVYVPAYAAHYTYGTRQVGSIEIEPQPHQALIAASGPAVVAGETHFSPPRSAAAAVSAVAAGKAAAVAAAGAAVPWDVVAAMPTVDAAFAAFLAGSAASVAARGWTSFARERRAARVEARAEAFAADYMQGGMSAESIEGARDLWLRADLEWLRWESEDTDAWVPERRRRAAERLLRDQKLRKCAASCLALHLRIGCSTL